MLRSIAPCRKVKVKEDRKRLWVLYYEVIMWTSEKEVSKVLKDKKKILKDSVN